MLGPYSGLIDIFVKYKDIEARCDNGTKNGSDLSIAGNYITFPPSMMFITMTVIILCNNVIHFIR